MKKIIKIIKFIKLFLILWSFITRLKRNFKKNKLISISLSPNTEKDDIWLVLKLILQPWYWKISVNQFLNQRKSAIEELEEEFKKYLDINYAFSFNSGRSAFLAILHSLELEKEAEILVQSFTCNAAVNPIIWSGLKPVYVDCDEKTFNIDIEDLKRKISSKVRAIMVQHTFGLPADIDEILKICEENHLILIEDCAHSLGAEYKDKKVGTFGKVAFFSFGRDKIISSVYGGMAITNDPSLAKKLRQSQDKFGYPPYCWIFQQLLHPVLMNWLILPFYKSFGKYLLVLFQQLQILSKAVHWKEKRGEKPDYFPKRLPNVLACLALNQFRKLERFNAHRKEIANFYRKELKNSSFELPPETEQTYLRFTIKHPKTHQIIKTAWQKNILIGDWYTSPIAPDDTKLERLQYKSGSCPKAEKLTQQTLNLPTHINISQKQAQEIIDFLKKLCK
jgi:dTDP-4-amino-4,6-dideoxygalactose transaminase